MLRRRCIPAKVHLGINLDDQLTEGHAWLQVKDEIVGDNPDVRKQYSWIASY